MGIFGHNFNLLYDNILFLICHLFFHLPLSLSLIPSLHRHMLYSNSWVHPKPVHHRRTMRPGSAIGWLEFSLWHIMSSFSFWFSFHSWDLQQTISWTCGLSSWFLIHSHLPWFPFMQVIWGSSFSLRQGVWICLSQSPLCLGEPHCTCNLPSGCLRLTYSWTRLWPSMYSFIYCVLGYSNLTVSPKLGHACMFLILLTALMGFFFLKRGGKTSLLRHLIKGSPLPTLYKSSQKVV